MPAAIFAECMVMRGEQPIQHRLNAWCAAIQWMLRITRYADRLLEDLDGLDWPDSIKDMQRNWIGRSEGAMIQFDVQGAPGHSMHTSICYNGHYTRARCNSGCPAQAGRALQCPAVRSWRCSPRGQTRCLEPPTWWWRPSTPLLEGLTSVQQRAAVQEYIQKAALKSDLERTELQKVKSGVFTGDHPMMGFFRHLASFDATGESSQGLLLWHAGSFALNPATREAVPIWVADYVLGSYGSGAIMAVPAHDARDFEFAQQYGLPVVRVVQDDAEEDAELPFTGL